MTDTYEFTNSTAISQMTIGVNHIIVQFAGSTRKYLYSFHPAHKLTILHMIEFCINYGQSVGKSFHYMKNNQLITPMGEL